MDRRTFLAQLASFLALLSARGSGVGAETKPDVQPSPSAGRLADLTDSTPFDVCIIGSGFAGAVLGQALVEHGLRTVILESGPAHGSLSPDPRLRELEVFRSIGPIDYPIANSRVRAIGGTSAIWTGRCPRLQPLDFAQNASFSRDKSWPITYKEIEPYYDRAENILRVRGNELSEFNPPRKDDLPFPANRDIGSLKSILDAAGVTVDDAPTSTGEDGDDSLRLADSLLPKFQASPHAALIAGATVTRLVAGEGGHIAGAEAMDLDRNTKIIRARAYVVGCGGLESPRLLLLSRSRHFPTGIGNAHDRLGRYFMEHRIVNYHGRVRAKGLQIYPQVGRSFQFDEEFRRQKLGGLLLGFILMTLRPGDFSLRHVGRTLEGLTSAFGRMRRPELRISANMETPARPDNRVTLDPKAKDYFGSPGLQLYLEESAEERAIAQSARQLIEKIYADLDARHVGELERSWSHHHMGTCRMGNDPKASVVDRNLRVHGSRNLFVTGSSVFVTSGASNPTLTLSALSLRLAEHLRSRLADRSFAPVVPMSRSASLRSARGSAGS